MNAAVPSRFQPLAGYLVEVGRAGVVLDCGRSRGVAVGDLFTVVQTGAPRIHSVTGRSLAAPEQLLSVLKVVRVEAEISFCQPLQRYQRVLLRPGLPVRRFAAAAALFIDLNGNGIGLFSRLREMLPQLNWADYRAGLELRSSLQRPGGPGVLGYDVFVVNQGPGLSLFNGDQELVGAFAAAELIAGSAPAAAASISPAAASAYDLTTVASDKASLTRYRQLGELNLVVKGMDVGDLEGDGGREIVFTDGEKIYIYQLTAQGLKYSYRYHFDKWGSIVNLQVADVTGDRRDEILVNTFKETEDGFSSFILAREAGRYRIIVENVPYVMGLLGGRSVADRESYFVGQGFAEEVLFNDAVDKLEFSQGKILSRGRFVVPFGFTLPGAVYADVNRDKIKELCFINRQNFLEIYQGEQRLWVSDERLAGSLQDVEYQVGTERISYTEKRQISSPLRVFDVDGDQRPELLLVDNESGISTAFGEYGFLSKGHVKVLRSQGSTFAVQKLTGDIAGPLQGIEIIGNELVCAMVKRGDDLLKLSGNTYLLAFPLPR
ncbi:MAG: VCBS repeat-containing protein [Deltaproteobacteria bacterium]|nr:VCBS repeat-containing protein [Deltaproteobacteria bacterium]